MREITLIFYKPAQPRAYGGVKQIMRRQKSYSIADDGIEHTVIIDLKDRMKDYFSLYKLVKDWGLEYIARGVKIENRYAREAHQHLEHFKEVLEKPALRFKCKTGFGCKFLDAHFKTWYKVGHFDRDEKWVLHKDELKQQLAEQIAKGPHYACPIFDENYYKEAVDQLPDKIDPDTDEMWAYRLDANGEKKGVMPVSFL